MDQRYGAWAQLLVLFRLVHDGGGTALRMPPRHGDLFDPDRYPFLEGRAGSDRQIRRAHRAAAGLRRDRLPRAREPARPRRRAALLPGARRRADRLGLRGDDGLPAAARDGPLDRGEGGQAPRRADRRSTSTRCSRSRPRSAGKWLKRARPTSKLPAGVAAAVRGGGLARGRCSPRWQQGRRPDGDAGPRPGRGAGAAADRRAPPLRLALHAALAHRADRAHDAASRSSNAARASGPDARADPRPEGLRPGDGLRRVPGRGVPAARRRAGRRRGACTRRTPAIPARRGRGRPRAPARRPALPVRRGQEPDRGGPGQAVAVAGDAGEGPPVHVPRPRAAARRLAGRPVARADRGVPLGARSAGEGFEAARIRGHIERVVGAARGDPRGGRRRVRRRAAAALATRRRTSSTRCA